MPSFWDLLPASAWPPQAFIPPFDPMQARWPTTAVPQWNPATSSAYGWSMVPAASAGTSLDAASASPWDSAPPQGPATPAGAMGDGGAVDDDPRVAEAKRAYDFARWMFGPPSAPQSSMRATALGGAPLNASPPISRDADQSGLGAATGNPNIERQGALARAVASQQPPPSWWQPVAASQMSTPAPDDASNAAPSPNEPAGAIYKPLTWTAADNALSWIQRQYEREDPEHAAAMERMADTRLGDVPSIDAPNAARRMGEGFAFGYGNGPIIQYPNIEPDTKITAGSYVLPDWAQPDARFLMRTANVAPQLLDLMLRGVRGGVYGAAGGIAGLYQDLGGSEAWADRLQRDLGIAAQYPLTDMSLARPMARAPAQALEPTPRDIARKVPLADSDAPASAPRPLAGPKVALDVGATQYTPEQADLIRKWLGIAPERFRGTVRVDPPLINGDILDAGGELMGHINRSISRDIGAAEHGLLLMLSDVHGQGLAKDILRANIDYYRKLGLSRVNVTALDRGGYVWARYGFLPSQESWDAVRPVLRDKILDPSLDLMPAERQKMLDLAVSRDPHAIWDIADNRTPAIIDGKSVMFGDKPLPLGNHLLLGSDWEGSLDLNDALAMRRFDHYVRVKK